MEIKNVYSGFELLSITRVAELEADVHFFRHRKTGAELVYTGRQDENKTFSIMFQTIPQDDTGVFHILEHSVLCGSDRYPVKEPFVELLKGSLNTFLNAMTFPDKTMYPVASRNDADFHNLMRVYLDAVFCPAIYHNENIFCQEGWRCEFDESGMPHYVGVVYGEMTGAMSSLDEIIRSSMAKQLFLNSCYGYNSGGDPDHIPELTYEAFLAAHKRYYHPSNARIFLDGTMDLEEILALLDGEYLSRWDRREPDFAIAFQEPLPYSQQTVCYAVSPEEESTNLHHFAMGRIASTWEDPVRNAALAVLQDCLAGSNSAPLTAAVLQRGLGASVEFTVDDGMAQNFVMLQVRNTTRDQLPGLKDALQEIIGEMVNTGISREELTASLNRLEFHARERTEPYGVQLAIQASQSWLYGGDPTQYLQVGAVFAALREKLDGTYFEDLLRELFLQDTGLAVLQVLPSASLESETARKRQDALSAMYQALDAADKSALQEKSRAVTRWQQTPDSEEALASMPHLALEDIPDTPPLIRVSETVAEDVHILRPEIKTMGTVYLDLYFALPLARLETLSAASLLCGVLTQLPTRQHTALSLQREIKANLGDMSFGVEVLGQFGKPDECTPYLRASVSVLESKADEAVALLQEVLLETCLDESGKVLEILRQKITQCQQAILTSGHQYGLYRALAGQTAEGAAAEHASGYAFYDWLRGLSAEYSQRFPALQETWLEIREAFTRANLTLCVTGALDGEPLQRLCCAFPQGCRQDARLHLDGRKPGNEALVIPAGIGYAVKATDLCRVAERKHGSFALLSKLVSLDYLWNEVRVQGGAYGAGLGVSSGGSLFCYSYRDPDPARSLDIYDKIPQYLRRCCREQKPLAQLIIGAVSDSEPLQSPAQAGRSAVGRMLRGITDEERITERRELLGTTHADLLTCCDLLEAAMETASVCVVAGETALDACKTEFDRRLRV